MSSPQRFVVASDNHGDLVDPESAAALFAFIADFRPQIRVHAGDCFDFRNLRRGASDEEKGADLQGDWEAGSDFLRRFFDGGKQNHFLRGNHDERLWKLRDNANGVMRGYAEDNVKRVEALVRRSRAQMLPFDPDLGILKLGNLSVVHGYFHNAHAVREHARTYGHCLLGDLHVQEMATAVRPDRPIARCIGCLCDLSPDYVSTKPGKMKWKHGFAYGLLFPDGSHRVELATQIKGKFYAATDFKAY